MNQIIIFLIGFVAGVFVMYIISGKRQVKEYSCGGSCATAEASEEKQDNKAEVLALFERGDNVTNDMVENALKVSDATAERYLDELEKEGLISQVGETGAGVYYVKK